MNLPAEITSAEIFVSSDVRFQLTWNEGTRLVWRVLPSQSRAIYNFKIPPTEIICPAKLCFFHWVMIPKVLFRRDIAKVVVPATKKKKKEKKNIHIALQIAGSVYSDKNRSNHWIQDSANFLHHFRPKLLIFQCDVHSAVNKWNEAKLECFKIKEICMYKKIMKTWDILKKKKKYLCKSLITREQIFFCFFCFLYCLFLKYFAAIP